MRREGFSTWGVQKILDESKFLTLYPELGCLPLAFKWVLQLREGGVIVKYFCVGYGKQTIYMWNNKRRKLLWNISTLLLNRTLWVTCCLQAVQTFSVIINIFLDYWVRTRSHTLCKLQTAGFIMHRTAMPEFCPQTHLMNCHEVNCTCTCSPLLHRSSLPVHHHLNPAKT